VGPRAGLDAAVKTNLQLLPVFLITNIQYISILRYYQILIPAKFLPDNHYFIVSPAPHIVKPSQHLLIQSLEEEYSTENKASLPLIGLIIVTRWATG
jgi:hypothetical protein